MSESKKLRISEIRRGVFIIERYKEGDWKQLNSKGEIYRKMPEDMIQRGLIPLDDKGEYFSSKDAEKAMSDFIFYPQIILTSEEMLEKQPVSGKLIKQCHTAEWNDSYSLKLDTIGKLLGKAPLANQQMESPEIIINTARVLDYVQDIQRLEDLINIRLHEMNLSAYMFIPKEINGNVENPI